MNSLVLTDNLVVMHSLVVTHSLIATHSRIVMYSLVMRPLVVLQLELVLATSYITRISKLAEPVMTATQVLRLFGHGRCICGTDLCMCVYMYTYL